MANTLRWMGLKQPTSTEHNGQMHLTVFQALKAQKHGEKAETILMSFLQLVCGIEAAE